MEEERELTPADELVEGSGVIVISRLFDQAVLLIGQVYNFIGYQRRLNILSTLIDINTKVKEILTEESLKLDDVDNEYLYGDSFEEKLIKITSAKQKLKSLFTGFQKKPKFAYSSTSGATNYHQSLFRQGPLPQDNQGGRGPGMFFARGNKRGTSCFSSVTSTISGKFSM